MPGCPSPATRILEPVSTPAGILTWSRLVLTIVPWPPQLEQARVLTSPVPRQIGQTSVDLILNVLDPPIYASCRVTSSGCSMLSPPRLRKPSCPRIPPMPLIPLVAVRPNSASKKSEKPEFVSKSSGDVRYVLVYVRRLNCGPNCSCQLGPSVSYFLRFSGSERTS